MAICRFLWEGRREGLEVEGWLQIVGLGSGSWVLLFAGADEESRHNRIEAIEGEKSPGEDTSVMAQDQGKAWATRCCSGQASKLSPSWSIRDSIHQASFSKWKRDLAGWKGIKNWVCWFVIDWRNWRIVCKGAVYELSRTKHSGPEGRISLLQLCTDALPVTQAGKVRQQVWHMYKCLCSVYLNIYLESFVYWRLQTYYSVLPLCLEVEQKSSCWHASDLVDCVCPGELHRRPLSAVRGWTSSPAQIWHWICLFPWMLTSRQGAGSVWFCCCEMLQLI